MAGAVRAARKYWPTDAFLKGKVVLDDLLLCSFATKNLVADWNVSTDRRWGGESNGTVQWRPWEAGRKQGTLDVQPWTPFEGEGNPAEVIPLGMLQSPSVLEGDFGTKEETVETSAEGGFLRFSGELSTRKAKDAKVGGFCGTRPPGRKYPSTLPNGYEGVEMRIRTDGRMYEVNFEPDSGILNDLYQGYVRTPPGEWTTLALPLNRLLLTGQGQVRELQRKWDDGMALKSIGFTIADGVAGPFQLDVAWVSLVQKVDAPEGDEEGNAARKRPARPENGTMSW